MLCSQWRGQRLSRLERLVGWDKNHKQSAGLTAAEWAQMPEHINVRSVPVLVTTRLDATLDPTAEIAQALRRRWRLEMDPDDLKTTLPLEPLRGESPRRTAEAYQLQGHA